MLLVLTLPLMVAIAVANRLDTPGPTLLRQTLKFRAMVHVPGPELAVSQAGARPYVSRVGRVLRRTKASTNCRSCSTC
jgi:lipopolysaccharide/colanic/teichoic acid biosynthesis glycosyltransferase